MDRQYKRSVFIFSPSLHNHFLLVCALIDLTPKTTQSYYRIRLFINKANNQILRIALYDKDNTIYTYHIEQFKSNVTLADSYFVFDKSKYPGVEVNDMR